jgi:hypothetical protein
LSMQGKIFVSMSSSCLRVTDYSESLRGKLERAGKLHE